MVALQTLAEPRRVEILELLRDGEQPVGTLVSHLGLSQPAVSKHLRILKDAGLVVSRTEGTRNVYSIDFRAIASMRSYLDRFWQKALTAFKDAVEKENGS